MAKQFLAVWTQLRNFHTALKMLLGLGLPKTYTALSALKYILLPITGTSLLAMFGRWKYSVLQVVLGIICRGGQCSCSRISAFCVLR